MLNQPNCNTLGSRWRTAETAETAQSAELQHLGQPVENGSNGSNGSISRTATPRAAGGARLKRLKRLKRINGSFGALSAEDIGTLSNMYVLVRAFLCAREILHSAMKKGKVLSRHLITAAQRYLEADEFQGRGLPRVHRLDCYGGELWSMRDIDDMIWAHSPSQDEEDFFTALYGTSLRSLVDTHMRHRHTDYCGGVNGGHCRCFYILRSPLFVKLPASHA